MLCARLQARHFHLAAASQLRFHSACRLLRNGRSQPQRRCCFARSSRTGKERAAEETSEGWDWLAVEPYLRRWEVPWGVGRLAGCLAACSGGFILTGAVVAPVLLHSLHGAGYLLGLQALETCSGVSIVWLCVRGERRDDDGLFDYSAAHPFLPGSGWLGIGLVWWAACFPVVGLAAFAHSVLAPTDIASAGTVDAVLPMLMSPSQVAQLSIVTGVLAPIAEETIFRGFVLPTLTRWVPTPAAILLSSGIFGLAHFAPRDTPQLIALGAVLGASYARSRNLLTPIFVHAAWNSGTLVVLTVLSTVAPDMLPLR